MLYFFHLVNLHGPEREYILLVEEDARLFVVLDPLHGVQEQGRPLVGDLADVQPTLHPPGSSLKPHPGLQTHVGKVGVFFIHKISHFVLYYRKHL